MESAGTGARVALALGLGAAGVMATMKAMSDRRVEEVWKTLEMNKANGERFSESMVVGLPAPARRYFLHAIKEGTVLARSLRWRWSGEMKPSRNAPWMALDCEQITAGDQGFAWRARASKGPVILTAADHYLEGEGRMRVALYGLVPIVNATGHDLSKASLGRLIAEGIFMPSSLLPGPNTGIEGVDGSRFTVTRVIKGERVPLTITVDEAGRVTETTMPRWGNLTDDGSFRYIPYGGVVEEERTFGGYTIPVRTNAGWWWGTERYLEVVHLQVDRAEYR